jgi:hypothetical protein
MKRKEGMRTRTELVDKWMSTGKTMEILYALPLTVKAVHRPLFDQQDVVRKANDLVRLALFCEHKRTPLRRDDITKKGSLFSFLFVLKSLTIADEPSTR